MYDIHFCDAMRDYSFVLFREAEVHGCVLRRQNRTNDVIDDQAFQLCPSGPSSSAEKFGLLREPISMICFIVDSCSILMGE